MDRDERQALEGRQKTFGNGFRFKQELFRPCRGLNHERALVPTAYAVGYSLSPVG